MKAIAVVPGAREVRLIEHAAPSIASPTEVRLRMLEVGICGTDKEICAFLYGTPPTGSDFLILGHESLGEVVAIGPQVTRVKPGDLAVLMVRRPCPHADCLACRAGRQDFCYTGDFTERGIKEAHGFMAEFVVDDERYIIPVPRALREVGVLVEPLTIAQKALAQLWQVQQRLPWACPVELHPEAEGRGIVPGKPDTFCHKAVVLGAGPVGLLGAMVLAANWFETIVYSLEPMTSPQAAFAKAIGARYVSSQTDPPARLAEQLGNIDLVYEATGAAKISFELLEVLGTNGVFIFTGVPGRRGPIELDADLIMRNLVLKNQIVYGTVNANRDAFEAAIGDLGTFMQRWPEAVRSLITRRYPIEEACGVLTGKPGGIKNIITFEGKGQ